MASNIFVIFALILVTSHYWSIVSSFSLSALPPPQESTDRKLNNSVFGKLLQRSHLKKCMFPFNEAEIIQDAPHIRKLNTLCNQTSEKDTKSESGPICILIVDLLSSFCDLTENYNPAQYSTPTTNLSLSREITQAKDKPVESVCNDLFKVTQERRRDSQPDLQNLYETFLPADEQTHKACQSACQTSYVDPKEPFEGDADAALKLNPLCIVLNISSITYNSVVARRLSSTSHSPLIPSTERIKNNGGVDISTNLGSSSTSVVVAKRKDPVFPNENTNGDVKEQVPVKTHSSSSAASSSTMKPLDKIKSTSKYELKGSMSSSSSTSSLTDLKDAEDIPPPVEVKNQPSTKASSPSPPVIPSKDGNPQQPVPDSNLLPSTQNKKPPVENKYDTAPVQSETSPDYDENVEVNDANEVPPLDANSDDDIPIYKQKPNDGDRPASKNSLQDTPNRKETFKYQPNVEVESYESGGYFNYFILFLTVLALCFLAFHNKRWLVAYIVEGRKPRGQRSRRRSSSSSGASYRRLENNFE